MNSPRRITFAIAVLLVLIGLLAVAAFGIGRSELWLPVRNSLWLAAAVCAISLPIGSLLAMLIVRTDTPCRGAATVLLTVMLLVPLYLQMTGWEAVVGKLGWQTGLFGSAGRPWLVGWRAVIWLHALAAIPWVTLIVGLGLRLVDPQLEEEALLNASSGQVFLWVTIPRALASLGVAALWVLTISAGELAVTNVYQIMNYAEALHTLMAWGDDSTQTWQQVFPSLLLTAVLLVAGLIFVSQLSPGDEITKLRNARRYQLGAWRMPAAILLWLLLLTIVVVPLAGLCYQAGEQTRLLPGQSSRSWSAAHFFDMTINNPWRQFGEAIGWTLLIGAVAATTTLLLAAPLAWWARLGGRRALPALFVSALFLAVPGPLLSLGLIEFMSNTSLPLSDWLMNRTIFASVVLMTVRALPLVILICWYALRTVGRDTLDSAATEGAGSAARFWRIAAAAHLPAFTAAWLTAFAVSMGDISATANNLALPPSVDTVSQRIFQMVHFGATDQLAGLALFCTTCFITLAVLLIVVLRRIQQGLEVRG